MRDLEPIRLSRFGGLYDRGRDDSVPADHFIEALDIQCGTTGIKPRPGSRLLHTISSVIRIHPFPRVGAATRLLILTSGGNLYDSTNLATPILTIAAMADFSVAVIYNRAYITPHNLSTGIASEKVYVYDGTGVARAAAGVGITAGAITATTSGIAGKVEAGRHLFAVVCETASGFLTKPGPTVWTNYLAPGLFKVDLSTIPVGPAGTVKRHIVSTRNIQNYDSIQTNWELYFIPGAIIADNVTTTLTVDFYDSDLLSSADYLLDILTEIPAGVQIGEHSGRMMVIGTEAKTSVAYVSRYNDPETFSTLDGFIIVSPGDGPDGLTNMISLGDLLYFTKPYRTYITQDNGQEPSNWKVPLVDGGLGAECFAVSKLPDGLKQTITETFIANRAGIHLFSGNYPPIPLSYKIEAIWKDILSFGPDFRKIQIFNDPKIRRIYLNIPIAGVASRSPYSGSSHLLLVGDYNEGLSNESIKWYLWKLNQPPVKMTLYGEAGNNILAFASTNNVHKISESDGDDAGVAISPYFITGLMSYSPTADEVCYWGALRVKLYGSAANFYLLQEDMSVQGGPWSMATITGQHRERRINFKAERVALKVELVAGSTPTEIELVNIYGKVLWISRPQ